MPDMYPTHQLNQQDQAVRNRQPGHIHQIAPLRSNWENPWEPGVSDTTPCLVYATTSSPIAACVPRQRLQRLCSTHLRQKAGRSAASWRGAFDLPALPGGREKVLWSGSTGMDAGRAAMGQGWPVAACPRSRTGARVPERSEGRTKGRGLFGSFWVLPKGTRCKSETKISVGRKCRICTQRIG